MKKHLCIAAIAALSLVSCSENDEKFNAFNADEAVLTSGVSTARLAVDSEEGRADFFKNKALVVLPRVESANNPSSPSTAKSFCIISYSDITSPSYIINGDDYNDLGEGNDEEANDGIYTSNSLYAADKDPFDEETLHVIYSDDFLYSGQLDAEFNDGTLVSKKIPPKVRKINCYMVLC